MLPNRLLLRAATVLALTRGGAGPFPTMAGPMVFDTRLRPITEIAQEAMTPVVLVYTDGDKRRNLDRNTQTSWCRTVSLVIEMAIGALGPQKIEWAETDPELEALLDLFEMQVELALFDPSNPWSQAWKRMVKRIEDWDSDAFRASEQASRYAVRQLHIACEIPIDCRLQPSTQVPEPVDVDPEDVFGIPYLAPLGKDMLENPIFASTLALIRSPGTVQMPMLKGLTIHGPKSDTPVDLTEPGGPYEPEPTWRKP